MPAMPLPNHHARLPPPKDEGAVDAWSVIYFFRTHAFVIVLAMLLGLTAGFAYLGWCPPTYSAHATLEVASDHRNLADLQQDRESTTDLSSASLLKTVEQTVCSDAVLGRVVAMNQLAADPDFVPPGEHYTDAKLIELLSHRVSVSLVRGTRLIAIAVKDRDPAKAQRLVQSIINEYFGRDLELRRQASSSAGTLLVAEADRIGAKLNESEQRLQQYREKYDAMGLADRQALVVERIRHLHEQVSNARSTRMTLESEQEQVVAALASGNIGKLLSLRSIADQPEVIELRKQLDLHNAEVASLSQRFGENHPTMIQAKRQAKETALALDESARTAGNAMVHSYVAAKNTEESLAKELARQEKSAVELDRDAIQYRAIERDVQANTALYQQLLARLKESDVVQNLMADGKFSGGFVKIIESPLVPAEPVWPRWKLVLPAGLLLGALLGCGLALGRHALDDSVTSVDDAEARLGVSTLAVVPRSRRLAFHRGRVAPPQPGTPDSEAFRSLRTSLMFLDDTNGANRAMMFTSAMPGEGKSCCSANYAAVVAQSGQRTLLIDGDLRRPTLRHAFNRHSDRPTLTDCLKDPNSFESAIDETPVRRLYLLGNSVGTPYSSEWLASGNLKLLLEKAVARFDRVVIDTAPVAVVSDALYFARLVPTVCFVVKAGRTSGRVVQRACAKVREVSGANCVGVVLNQIQRNRSASYHYYYHTT
jgi:capsular exopolysaccharide synthesis family protein